jgi:peptide/nickel transport system substrate-binding protein
MKKIVSLFLALAMALSLAACGTPAAPAPSNASDKPGASAEKGEKVLRIGELWDITTIDPVSDGTLMKEKASVIETLVEVDDHFGLREGLAVKWENTEPNEWIFTIREGVSFHNGEKLDAEAVVWSLNNAFEQNPTHMTKTNVEKIEAVSEYEVKVTTSSPNAEIPEYMHTSGLGIIHKDSYDASGNLGYAIGTGPFKVESFDASTGVLTVVKNAEYWGGAPALDKVVITGMSDSMTRALALESDQIDFTCDLPFNEIDRLDALDGVYVESYDTARVYSGFFNCGDPKFADKKVRHAVSLAIDREIISKEVLFGAGTPAKNMYNSNMAWNNPEVDGSKYDKAEALALLEETGWKDTDGDGILDKNGEKFAFTIYTYPERPGLPLIAEAMQAMLGEIGMDVNIVTQSSGTFSKEVRGTGTEWGLYLAGMATCMLPSCYNFLDSNYRTANSEPYGYKNEKFDELIAKAKGEFDTEKRYEISREIQALAEDELNIMYICNYGVSYGFRDRVSNFVFNPTAHDYQWNIDIAVSD